MMPWWHRFYFLCATVLLFLSSDVLAAPHVSSREELLNHHEQAVKVGSVAAEDQKALMDYHHNEACDYKTSPSAENHEDAWYGHKRILDRLNKNLAWHGKRIDKINAGHAAGSRKELKRIDASHKFAVAAGQNACEANAIAKDVGSAKRDFSLHGPYNKRKRNDEARQTARQRYNSATDKTQEHAQSFADHWHLRPQ